MLIDLDGTLLDTAPDLAAAANRMLMDLGMPSRDLQAIAAFVGKGIPMLVRRALAGSPRNRVAAVDLMRAHTKGCNGCAPWVCGWPA